MVRRNAARGRSGHNLFPDLRVTDCAGKVDSPLLNYVLLTLFDREMRRRVHRLTRNADGWLLTRHSRGEACAALETVKRILAMLGMTLNAAKTQMIHVRPRFEFLGLDQAWPATPLASVLKDHEQGPHGNAQSDSAGQVQTQLQGLDLGVYPPQGYGYWRNSGW